MKLWLKEHEDRIWWSKWLALLVLLAAALSVVSWNIVQELQTVTLQRDLAELKLLTYRERDLAQRLKEAEDKAIAAPTIEPEAKKPRKPKHNKRRKKK